MKKLFECRRTFLAFMGMVLCASLGWALKDITVVNAIVILSLGVSGSNAAQAIFQKKSKDNEVVS